MMTLQFSLNPSHREILHGQDSLVHFTDKHIMHACHVIGQQKKFKGQLLTLSKSHQCFLEIPFISNKVHLGTTLKSASA